MPRRVARFLFSIRVKLRRYGRRYRVRVKKPGLRSGRVTVRTRRR